MDVLFGYTTPSKVGADVPLPRVTCRALRRSKNSPPLGYVWLVLNVFSNIGCHRILLDQDNVLYLDGTPIGGSSGFKTRDMRVIFWSCIPNDGLFIMSSSKKMAASVPLKCQSDLLMFPVADSITKTINQVVKECANGSRYPVSLNRQLQCTAQDPKACYGRHNDGNDLNLHSTEHSPQHASHRLESQYLPCRQEMEFVTPIVGHTTSPDDSILGQTVSWYEGTRQTGWMQTTGNCNHVQFGANAFGLEHGVGPPC